MNVGCFVAGGAGPLPRTLRRALRRGFLDTSPGKNAAHQLEVPLMTRVLVNRRLTLFQPNPDGPWLRPGRRIGKRDFVADRVRCDTRETFDHMQVLVGSHDIASGREVGRLDDERVPLPSAPRVPAPLTDALAQMRPA